MFYCEMALCLPPMLTLPNIEQSTNSEHPIPHWKEQAGFLGPSSLACLVAMANPVEPGSWDRWASGGSSQSVWVAEGGEGG